MPVSKQPTTMRIDPRLHGEALREARKAGLTFSGIVHLLLSAFVDGTVHVGVTQYPTEYLAALGKEADQLRRLHRSGKAKSYSSAKKLFDDILDR